MKRTLLRRKTPLRSNVLRVEGRRFVLSSALHSGRSPTRSKTKHARRLRAPEYMAWVKTLLCYVRAIAAIDFPGTDRITPCGGPVEADHAGSKMTEGDGTRAYDATCIPMCCRHHRERHDFSGTFRAFDQAMMRTFLSAAIGVTQAKARDAGVDVPSC